MITVTAETLLATMPGLKRPQAEAFAGPLTQACREFEINTPTRLAAFLAQIGHETNSLRWFEELASGKAYDTGRLAERLGNTPGADGDGQRYKGRGAIQLTGRANYRTAGAALGLDLEGNPERADDLDVCFRIAGWYWHSRKLNAHADAGEFAAITKRINGGFNGAEDRNRRHGVARAVLGC